MQRGILNLRNEVKQQIDLKEWLRKVGSIVWLSCVFLEFWSLAVKMAYFMVFSADDSKKLVIFLAKYLSVPES